MLRNHNLSHIHEAIIWLRANKDKFRAPIYEPPIISVSLPTYFLFSGNGFFRRLTMFHLYFVIFLYS